MMDAGNPNGRADAETLSRRARRLIVVLNAVAAISAAFAALYWAWSASIDLPPIQGVYGGIRPDDPFFLALNRSASLSATAARWAGLSAAAWALATVAQSIGRRQWLEFRLWYLERYALLLMWLRDRIAGRR